MLEHIPEIKDISVVDWIVIGLVFVLISLIAAKIYSRYTSTTTIESKSLGTYKIDKICMDLPQGITECVESNTPSVYKILVVPTAESDIHTIYLKVK